MVHSISVSKFLSTTDYIVFILVLFVTVGAMIWGHVRKSNTIDESNSILEYMLMGRRLTLPMFIATLVATWYGGIFGVTEIAFKHGVYNFITQGVFWYISYILFALFLVNRIRAFEAVTLPEMVTKMFGPVSVTYCSSVQFFQCSSNSIYN